MIHIDRHRFLLSDEIHEALQMMRERQDAHFNRSDGLYRQMRFKGNFEKQMVQIKACLRQVFQDKCAYCERVIGDSGQIDRYRPRSGRSLPDHEGRPFYWWLEFDIDNLYFVCPNCNSVKANAFPLQGNIGPYLGSIQELRHIETPLILDPCDAGIDPEQQFISKEDGLVAGITEVALATIDLLRLNRDELRHARAEYAVRDSLELRDLYEGIRINRVSTLPKCSQYLNTIFEGNSPMPFLGFRRNLIVQKLTNTPFHSRQNLEYWQGELLRLIPENQFALIELVKGMTSSRNIQQQRHHSKHRERQLVQDFKKLSKELDEFRTSRVKGIYLRNFLCFSNFELSLLEPENIESIDERQINITEPESSEDNGNNSNWIILLGENAMGKSSLLQAFAIGLSGSRYIRRLKLKASEFLKNGETEGEIRIAFDGETEELVVNITRERFTFSSNNPKVRMAAYHAVRLSEQKRWKTESTSDQQARAVRVENLFDPTSPLVDPIRWLCKVEQRAFDRAAMVLRELLGLGDQGRIERVADSDQNLIDVSVVYPNQSRAKISELSEGYRSVFCLAVDIMATFEKEDSAFDEVRGLVMIDELGTHLHPRWKMEVVTQFRNSFPNIDFIVSTHEPLCLVGAKHSKVIVLQKDLNGDVFPVTDLPDHSAMRVDQILTSPFFGLHSAMDPDMQKKFERYYELLAKGDRIGKVEMQELLQKRDEIEKVKYLGDTIREQLALIVIDQVLAERINKKPSEAPMQPLQKEVISRLTDIWNQIESNADEIY